MKILNLYSGIGGNRKLWGNEHDITAVEINPEVAHIYQDIFPNDKVIVTDAHQYLLEHFKEFDFIWSSPKCQTHSKLRKNIACSVEMNNPGGRWAKPVYPDLSLYEEIIFLVLLRRRLISCLASNRLMKFHLQRVGGGDRS